MWGIPFIPRYRDESKISRIWALPSCAAETASSLRGNTLFHNIKYGIKTKTNTWRHISMIGTTPKLRETICVLSANIEGEEFMTAAHRQGSICMFWLHLWGTYLFIPYSWWGSATFSWYAPAPISSCNISHPFHFDGTPSHYELPSHCPDDLRVQAAAKKCHPVLLSSLWELSSIRDASGNYWLGGASLR